jgi:O-antigen/teichoic acid export membrane protein
MKPSTKKDYFYNTIGSCLTNLLTLFLLLAIAHINNFLDVGTFSLALGISGIFFAVSLYGGRSLQISDVKHDFSDTGYIFLKYCTSTIALIAAITFLLINGYTPTQSFLTILLLLYYITLSISDAIYGVIQKKHKLYLTGKYQTYKIILGLSLFILTDLLTKNLLLASAALIISNLLIIITCDIPKMRELSPAKLIPQKSPRLLLKDSKNLLIASFPIFALVLLQTIPPNLSKYFIDLFHPYENGYFGIIIMPLSIMSLLASLIISPLIVPLATNYHKKRFTLVNQTLKKICLLIIAIGILVTFATYLIGTQILSLVFSIDLSAYRLPLSLVVISSTLFALSSTLVTIFIIARRMKTILLTYLISIILNICLSIWLINTLSVLGAIIPITVSNFATLITLIILLYRQSKQRTIYLKYEKNP